MAQLHVDFDFQWTGSDPASEFKLIAKLGQGYCPPPGIVSCEHTLQRALSHPRHNTPEPTAKCTKQSTRTRASSLPSSVFPSPRSSLKTRKRHVFTLRSPARRCVPNNLLTPMPPTGHRHAAQGDRRVEEMPMRIDRFLLWRVLPKLLSLGTQRELLCF